MLTYSSTVWDSRIRRFVSALDAAGFTVSLVSADVDAALPGMTAHYPVPALSGSRRDLLVHLATAAPSGVWGALALPLHRLLPSYRAAMRALRALRPDIIHANDWVTLPAALDAAAETGARVIYDSHEFATEEHADKLWWRLFMRPHVATLEHLLIDKASTVLTVGQGLAVGLKQLYGSKIQPPTVIRNLPGKVAVPYQIVKEAPIRLVYAGLLRPERCVGAMIEAVALAGDRFNLDVIGFGPEAYVNGLSHQILRLGLESRVKLLPPVLQSDLILALASYDVGLFLSDGAHAQQRYALPNKIFDYIAAGLAIVTSGSLDVSELIEDLQNGVSTSGASAQAVATALTALSQDALNQQKANSWAAAQRVSWETEAKTLIEAYKKLI